MNLGLPSDAYKLFNLVPNEYPNIENERREARLKSNVSSKAENIVRSIVERANA
jgi:hypothetical protein